MHVVVHKERPKHEPRMGLRKQCACWRKNRETGSRERTRLEHAMHAGPRPTACLEWALQVGHFAQPGPAEVGLDLAIGQLPLGLHIGMYWA